MGTRIYLCRQPESVEIRHLKIDKSQCERLLHGNCLFQRMERSRSAIGDRRPHSPANENFLENASIGCAVIHNEHAHPAQILQFTRWNWCRKFSADFEWKSHMKSAAPAWLTLDADLSVH